MFSRYVPYTALKGLCYFRRILYRLIEFRDLIIHPVINNTISFYHSLEDFPPYVSLSNRPPFFDEILWEILLTSVIVILILEFNKYLNRSKKFWVHWKVFWRGRDTLHEYVLWMFLMVGVSAGASTPDKTSDLLVTITTYVIKFSEVARNT